MLLVELHRTLLEKLPKPLPKDEPSALLPINPFMMKNSGYTRLSCVKFCTSTVLSYDPEHYIRIWIIMELL